MDRQFTALRIIGTVFKVLAWLVLILGLLAGAFVLVAGFFLTNQLGLASLNLGGPLAGIVGFAVILILTVFGFLFLYAVGESAYLFLSIEENTRRIAYFAQQEYTARQPAYPPTAPADYEE
jgi:hypothetical protein